MKTVVCEANTLLEQEAHSQIRNVILGIFFVSLLFVGIGQTAVSTLGIPYIDDNVASKESAVYIGTCVINAFSRLRLIVMFMLIICFLLLVFLIFFLHGCNRKFRGFFFLLLRKMYIFVE